MRKRENLKEYIPPIKVYCPCNQEWSPEEKHKFLNIEEDIQGRDVLTFECFFCGASHKSLRVG